MCKQRRIPFISHCETIDPNKHWTKVLFISILLTLKYLQKVFQTFWLSLIYINMRLTQKIRNRIGKNLRYTSNMHEIGIWSNSTLNIRRKWESMSSENVSIADSPDSTSKILKKLRLANVNRLIYAQLKFGSSEIVSFWILERSCEF